MKNRFIYTLSSALLILSLATMPSSVLAQRGGGGGIRTDTRILYHDGPVMQGTIPIYFIWYGNWSGDTGTVTILTDFASGLGSSPFFLINTTYPDSSGNAPNGGAVYIGSVADSYSQGPSLTVENIQQIVWDRIASGQYPLDTRGIYVVVASADVTDIQPDGSSFCTPGATPHHGVGLYEAAPFKYVFLGGADRCPTSAGPQFVAPDGTLLPTPNNNFAADAMASTLARLINATVTNPMGYSGWFDRYGLQNSDKCVGKFGTVYTTPNGAKANMRLAGRDFLVQQNWINDRKGRCTLSIAN